MWYVLAAVAFTLLFLLPGKNAIGGGLTIGTIIGLLAAFFYGWTIIGKCIVVFMLLGAAVEVGSMLLRKKQ